MFDVRNTPAGLARFFPDLPLTATASGPSMGLVIATSRGIVFDEL